MKIISRETIAEVPGTRITKLKIHAPLIAQKAKAGQFIVVMADEKGERIPLTVVDKDPKAGDITLIVQEIGFSTKLLGSMKAGDPIYAIAGPMGHATPIKNYGKVVLVAGGVGIAEIYPLAKAFKEGGNYVIVIIGTRTKGLLFLENELKAVSDELHVTTDDGSYGRKGFVTDVLKEALTPNPGLPAPSLVYAVGPIPMMKFVSQITKDFNVKTIVSLNAIMIDASGMCGGCRVKVGDEVKFSCVDGPEFDAHLVDWDELGKRSKTYTGREEHICRLKNL